MRLPSAVLLSLVVTGWPALSRASDSVDLVSDLDASVVLVNPDNPAALGLDPGPQVGLRIRYDGAPYRGIPYAFAVDLVEYGWFTPWDFSASLGAGYWFGPVSVSLLGGLGLEAGGKPPHRAPLLLTTHLRVSTAVDLGDMFRLRAWLKPTWLVSKLQSEQGDAPFSDFTHTQPFLPLAGRPSDELDVGAALAITLPKRGPSNQLYNGSLTFWVGTEYRAALKNRMIGFFVGFGAATAPTDG
jgi:hypothetical protein